MKKYKEDDPKHSVVCPKCDKSHPLWSHTRYPFNPEPYTECVPVYRCPDETCQHIFAPLPQEMVWDLNPMWRVKERLEEAEQRHLAAIKLIEANQDQPEWVRAFLTALRNGRWLDDPELQKELEALGAPPLVNA